MWRMWRGRRLARGLLFPGAMQKTGKRKLALRSETIRWLCTTQLEPIDGGFGAPDDTMHGACDTAQRRYCWFQSDAELR
jgi:hypothetical protein